MLNTKQSYSEKLKNPKWQKKRLEIFKRDKFKCTLCKDDKTPLAVHHKKYTGESWEAPNSDLKTVCEHCHTVLHEIKEHEIIKVVKRIVEDSVNFCAYSKSAVFLLYIFNGSPIILITELPYDSVKTIFKNLPKSAA